MDTKELRALVAAGTAGEWRHERDMNPRWEDGLSDGVIVTDKHRTVLRVDNTLNENTIADARLIARLHNVAPLLLDVLEAAESVSGEAPLLGPHNMLCVVDPKKIAALRTALEAFHAAR